MSDWKILNLLDVDDSAAGRLEGLEARMGRNELGSRDVGVSLFRYGPGVRNPMSHTHREQEEAAWTCSRSVAPSRRAATARFRTAPGRTRPISGL